MKVLFLATHLNSGGITSYLFNLTKGLRKKECSIVLVTGGGDREKDFVQLGAKAISLNIHTKSELDPRLYWALGELKKIIKDNHIDIIHAQTRVTQVMAQFLKRSLHKPFVSTCHGFFKKRLSRIFFPCWGDKVIAISPAVKDHLKNDFGVEEGKIALIPHGINIEELKLIDDTTKKNNRAQWHIADKTFVIGHIGRLSDVKGQDILIQAMPAIIKEIPKVKLLIVGEGREEETLKKLVQDLKLHRYIEFIPILNHAQQMLSLFDIFVMPSLQEGLGLSIMEAQSCGLCVVASKVGGIPTLIEDGRTGVLVEPKDPVSLSKAIVGLYYNRDKMRQLGLAARGSIAKNFSSEMMVDRTYQVYRELIK